MQECEARLAHPLPAGSKPCDIIARFKQARLSSSCIVRTDTQCIPLA